MTKTKLVFAVSALLGAQASSAADEYSNAFLQAMERDLGVAKAELPQYISAEKFAGQVEQLAEATLGSDFAGSWMERIGEGKYRHVVATTDATAGQLRNGTETRVVEFSLAQLDAGIETLNNALSEQLATHPAGLNFAAASFDGLQAELSQQSAPQLVIQSMYTDVKSNMVVVNVAPEMMDAAIDLIAATDIDAGMVDIQTSAGKPTALVTTFGGREYQSGGGFCSIGFPIRRNSDNRRGFVTAGHCGPRNTDVRVGGTRVGRVVRANYPGDDMAWAAQRQSDRQIPFVTRYNGGNARDVRIRGSNRAAIGASICRSGRTTGYRCGTVTSRNSTVNYGDGPVRGLTQSTACAGRGDSGGSWITPAGQAQGVTSGGQLTNGNDNCGAGRPVTWFQPVNEILNRYGLRLVR